MNNLSHKSSYDEYEIVYDNDRVQPNADGSINLANGHLSSLGEDTLYHLGLSTHTHDLVSMFGDVRYVCMGGTVQRMTNFARLVARELGMCDQPLVDITAASHRYAMFKVGPVLSVSHGMGISSLSILMHEVIKLIHYARAKHVVFFRIGTCGGLGIEQGSLVITRQAVDELLRPFSELRIMNKIVRRPCAGDASLLAELESFARTRADVGYKTVVANTMCALDFYEQQCRLDGAICTFNEQDKYDRLKTLVQAGVRNIEMEATTFLSMCHYSGIRAAIVCVTLLNRLEGDQISSSKQHLELLQQRPQDFVLQFIKSQLYPSQQ